MPTLDVTSENLAFELDELLAYLGTARRVEVHAAAIDGVARLYRQLAIADLLSEANTDAFFAYLSASGLAQADLLERVRWDDVVDFQYLCASRLDPFLDAVAAGDRETAARIARASRPVWSSEDEAEADFLRARWLMGLVAPGAVPAPDALLARLAELTDPGEDPRTAACLALQRRDAAGFEGALRNLVLALEDEWAAERKNPNRDPEQMLTEAYVSVEGIALVRLASGLGLPPLSGPLPLLPGLALFDPPPPLRPTNAWKQGA